MFQEDRHGFLFAALWIFFLSITLISPVLYATQVEKTVTWSQLCNGSAVGPLTPFIAFWLFTSWIAYWLLHLISRAYNKILGYIVRHYKVIDSATARLLEYSSSLSRHTFRILWALINWYLMKRIVPSMAYTDLIERIAGRWVGIICLLILVEKIVLHTIVTGFHRTVYNGRVRACLEGLWVVKTLQKVAISVKYKSNPAEALIKKAVKPEYDSEDLVTAFLLENSTLSGNSANKGTNWQKKLFNFLTSGGDVLRVQHLRLFFVPSTLDDAFKLFSPLQIECHFVEFSRAIEFVYSERRDLVKILSESDDLIRKLDQILKAILILLAVFLLVPVSGAILPISFGPLMVILTLAFADTIRSITAAIVFIFATHPFDIGDLVYMERGTYTVRQVRLLSTLFTRWDGIKVIYPNSVLASMAISNLRRTGPQAIRFEVNVSADTLPASTISILQGRLQAFVQEHPEDYVDIQSVLFELRTSLNRLVLVFKLRLSQSFQEPYRRSLRFNKFWAFAKDAMTELGMTFETPILLVENESNII